MSAQAFELPLSYKATNPVSADYYYGKQLENPLRTVPYASVTEACTLVPQGVRYGGMTVNVAGVEYQWKDANNLSDAGLTIKAAGGAGAGGGLTRTSYAKALADAAGNKLNGGGLYCFTDYPNARDHIYVFALDGNAFAGTGWFYDGQVQNLIVDVPAGTFSSFGSIGGGAAAPEPVFDHDIFVSLAPGQTWGKWKDGDTVSAKGKTTRTVIEEALIDSKNPTYAPASISINMSAPAAGEVGELVNNAITANFASNDAGALKALRVLKAGALLGSSSSTTPHAESESLRRILGVVPYQASADYSAGALKNITPANTPDTRPAQVRNPNAPQAAENDYRSGVVNFAGYYRYFHGPAASQPANSAAVRNLAASPLTISGNTQVLSTGSTNRIFCIAVPPGKTLAKVIDASASNADLTSQYQPSNVVVNDAAGNPVNYTLYTMVQAVPYNNSHEHVITLN